MCPQSLRQRWSSARGNRSAAARAALTCASSVGPFTAKGEDLGVACVRPSEIERTVGVHGQRGRQLCVRHGRVPVASAEVRVAQVRQDMGLGSWRAGRCAVGRRQCRGRRSRRLDRRRRASSMPRMMRASVSAIWTSFPEAGQKVERRKSVGAPAIRGGHAKRLGGAGHGYAAPSLGGCHRPLDLPTSAPGPDDRRSPSSSPAMSPPAPRSPPRSRVMALPRREQADPRRRAIR